jgi:ABC-type transporter Mla MlaB component
MLKISCSESGDNAQTLRLEGHVSGPWVEELRGVCERLLAQGQQLTLDLAGVSFLDLDGITLVRGLAARHVALFNRSPFVAEQFRG